MNRKYSFAFLATAICVTLAGCGNSDISKVKAMKLDVDPSLTVGQAFDHRKVCESIKWDTLKDNRGRKIVKYGCAMNGFGNLVSKEISDKITVLDKAASDERKRCNYLVQSRREDLDNSNKDLKKAKKDLELLKNSTVAGNAYFSGEQIKNGKISDLNSKIQFLSDQSSQDQKNLTTTLNFNSTCLANSDYQKRDFMSKFAANPPVRFDEIFQWAVSDDGSISEVFSGTQITYKNGVTKDSPYGDSEDNAKELIVKNTDSTYAEYRQQLAVQALSGLFTN